MFSMQRCFVSGITSGIGYALAEKLLACGMIVYGLGRRPQPIVHDRLHYRQIDLGKLATLDCALHDLFADCPGFDVAILNAAMLGRIGTLRDTPAACLQQQMDTNLWAQKCILDALLSHSPAMKLVVSLSSGAALEGGHGWNGYSISKAALRMMIEIYAAENVDVQFVSLSPGLVGTEMYDDLGRQAQANAATPIANACNSLPKDRLITPAQFATAFVALLPSLFEYESGSYVDVREPVREYIERC